MLPHDGPAAATERQQDSSTAAPSNGQQVHSPPGQIVAVNCRAVGRRLAADVGTAWGRVVTLGTDAAVPGHELTTIFWTLLLCAFWLLISSRLASSN